MIDPVSWAWQGANLSIHGGTLASTTRSEPGAFRQLMQDALASWRVSQHATHRMEERGISLTSADWRAMEQAAKQAESKGARDAYMVMGDVGFVVHLPSRTLVTALKHEEHPIVTQIDSVVFVSRPDR
ncbi:hypothetical protein [Alicyclobacillus acidocaldarius]|uniref:Flagellar operon protein n=1 Tax=Alicyclobacillus acidocaldarius (strain Tc-4-1) TaxID=1048834 RepID=F8IHY1_ALIAT|nr:hypothetical protein [Alicyclobacillus acidocaldarius]AEJ43271.1 hypothetical protein TC41_1334 [Alicyclobacillus acidocaldarius subsp. acidocaldarius Tc-4-1]